MTEQPSERAGGDGRHRPEGTLPPHARSAAIAFGLAVLALASLFAVGSTFADGFVLDLGSTRAPAPRYAFFLAFWTCLGGLAIGALATGLALLAGSMDAASRVLGPWLRGRDRTWILCGVATAAAIPALIRGLVLQGAPLTDDESAYRFMGQLLATGRVFAESPPDKLFFDRAFMINDGRMYAKYFLGWPALMAPGVWLGAPGFMNALYSAATVPALYALLRRWVGAGWARVGLVLFVSSPMLMIGAATELSHTSATCALAWTLLFAARSRDPDAPAGIDALLALAFSIAFFIRPVAAIGIGIPALVWWAFGLGDSRPLVRRLAAFAIPAASFAVLFLGTNVLQSGSPFSTGYAAELAYASENGFRFTNVQPEELERPPEFDFGAPVATQLANTTVALLRLNYAFLGWPSSFLFLVFCGLRREAALPLACAGSFVALHFATHNAGIDSFGPVHFFELCLPLLLLTVLGLERTTGWLSTLGARRGLRPAVIPAAVCAASIAITLAGYVPVRLAALARMADNVNMPLRALEERGLERAVVFASRPFAHPCRSAPTRHFVFWRPNNDPDLSSDLLWANHIDVESDRRLMRRFPDRTGWVMLWTQRCEVALVPLDGSDPDAIPRGYVGGVADGSFARNPRDKS